MLCKTCLAQCVATVKDPPQTTTTIIQRLQTRTKLRAQCVATNQRFRPGVLPRVSLHFACPRSCRLWCRVCSDSTNVPRQRLNQISCAGASWSVHSTSARSLWNLFLKRWFPVCCGAHSVHQFFTMTNLISSVLSTWTTHRFSRRRHHIPRAPTIAVATLQNFGDVDCRHDIATTLRNIIRTSSNKCQV